MWFWLWSWSIWLDFLNETYFAHKISRSALKWTIIAPNHFLTLINFNQNFGSVWSRHLFCIHAKFSSFDSSKSAAWDINWKSIEKKTFDFSFPLLYCLFKCQFAICYVNRTTIWCRQLLCCRFTADSFGFSLSFVELQSQTTITATKLFNKMSKWVNIDGKSARIERFCIDQGNQKFRIQNCRHSSSKCFNTFCTINSLFISNVSQSIPHTHSSTHFTVTTILVFLFTSLKTLVHFKRLPFNHVVKKTFFFAEFSIYRWRCEEEWYSAAQPVET